MKKYDNKTIEKLIFRYFNIRNFEISVVLHLIVQNFELHPKISKFHIISDNFDTSLKVSIFSSLTIKDNEILSTKQNSPWMTQLCDFLSLVVLSGASIRRAHGVASRFSWFLETTSKSTNLQPRITKKDPQ